MRTIAEALAEAGRLFDLGALVESEELYRSLHSLEPTNDGLMRMLGILARKQGRLDESRDWLERAVQLQEASAFNHFELGTTLVKLEQKLAALPHFLRTIELDPHFQQAYVNVGAVHEHMEQFDKALPYCLKAVELNPECAVAHYNLGNVLREAARLADANREFQRAIELNPDSAKAHWNSAFCHLALGNFSAGWREYEWREAAGEVTIDRYTQPRWGGSSLAGKTLLVHAEQGIGDEILFSSCLPDVIERAGQVIVVCERRLVKLFERSFPRARIHGWQRRKDWSPAPLAEAIDYQIPAGSVPLYVRTTRESFPKRARFLYADPARSADWQRRLAELGPGIKVGISWQAGGQPVERRKRTTPLALWQGIFATPNVQFVNLQYGERSEELRAARSEFGIDIHDFADGDPLLDMDDYAALVASLDLVISVGNATVHLAGALGTPAWALLPLVPSWRWMSSGDQSPWYSRVRLFRQAQRDDWQPVFERVTQMLHEKVGADYRGPSRSRSGLGWTAEGEIVVLRAPSERRIAAESPLTERPAEAGARGFDRVSGVQDAFEEAMQRFNAGDLTRAEAICREILDHTPRNIGALHLLAVVARQTGRVDLAIRSLQRAMAVADTEPQLHAEMGAALKDAGQLQQAVLSYVRALELKPDYVDAFIHLGNLLRKMKNQTEALRCHQEAIRLDNNNAMAHNALGAGYLDAGLLDEAVESFQAALRIEPDSYLAHNNLGRALESLGRFHDALDHYYRALQMVPMCCEALLNMGSVLEKLDHPREALRIYQQILEAKSDRTETSARTQVLENQKNHARTRVAHLTRTLASPNEAHAAPHFGSAARLVRSDIPLGATVAETM